ncbi:kelch-like protein 10 [Zootermopsis nevadensis]|nr:kelch-like protein 10 [Zootermopsis nevadensis]
MLSRRASFSCVAFHGCLYALGGYNGEGDLPIAEKYDPANDTWTEIPDMLVYSSFCNAEVIDDMIFVIGGFFDKDTIFGVESFNGNGDERYQAADMNFSRYDMSTCVIKNLSNARDYAYKHRNKLLEEKRKEMLDLENSWFTFDYCHDKHINFN